MKFFKRRVSLNKLDYNKLPILDAEEIINLLGLKQKIRSIERLSASGTQYFKALYYPAIRTYLESVQLVPASVSHHHAGPGGLATHTIDVIDRALRARKNFNLPLHSDTETIYREEHIWTYGIFAGALLHDVGKIVCASRIQLDNGKLWTPHENSILKSGANSYSVEFVRSKYKLHTLLSSSFFHMLPVEGRKWLTEYEHILEQLIAWLHGDIYSFGTLGEIIRKADSESTADNLRIGGDRQRFPNAPSIPLVDRLTTTLRQLLSDGKLKVNHPDGSSGWCDNQYIYLVCGTVADAVRNQLNNLGAKDIPTDNSRIFDIWQEHDFLVSTPENGSIWNLTINDKLNLTVLKFELSRLYPPGQTPAAFTGKLDISSARSFGVQHTKKENIATIDPLSLQETDTAISDINHIKKETVYKDVTTDVAKQQTEPVETNHAHNMSMVVSEANNEEMRPVAKTALEPETKRTYGLDDPDIAVYFLDWLREGINNKTIFINRSNALVHVVKEGVLVVSPLSFKKFIREFNLASGDITENDATKRIQNRLQKMMRKAKLHKKTSKGLNIHTYSITGPNRDAKIKGWLFTRKSIFGDKTDLEVNKVLSNISGFSEKTPA